MVGPKKLAHHAHLVERMGQAVGADLGEALAAGRIGAETVRTAVLRCTGCESAGPCADWLADPQSSHDHAPGYCRNASLFAALSTPSTP